MRRKIAIALASALCAAPPAPGSAETCYPQTIAAEVLGSYVHIERHWAENGITYRGVAAAVARSEQGGLIWCHFKGDPDALENLVWISETDAAGVETGRRDRRFRSQDGSLRRVRKADPYVRACARGLGPCYLKERGYRQVAGRSRSIENVFSFDRTCERRDGDDWYVRRLTAHEQYTRRDGKRDSGPLADAPSIYRARHLLFGPDGVVAREIRYAWWDKDPNAERPAALPPEMTEDVISRGRIDGRACLDDQTGCRVTLDRMEGDGWQLCMAYARTYGARQFDVREAD